MIIWQAGKEWKRVAGGKKAPLTCTACKKQTVFYECQVDDIVRLYLVLDVWKRSKRAMQCGECLGFCDYYEAFPKEKENEAQAKAEQERLAAEALLKKKQAEEKEQKAKEELAQLKRDAERKRMDKEVEDELAKMKRQLGK